MKSWICGLLLSLLLAGSGSLEAQDRSADIYTDGNCYFIVVVPAGWRIQGYPEETIRSKVRFNHPRLGGVNIGIIAAPSPRTPYSLDDLLHENRAKSDEIKRAVPGASFTVVKERVTDRDAVVSRIQRGGSEVKTVAFIQGALFYQITLYTGSQKERDAVSEIFSRFLKSVVILGRERITDADRKGVLVSRYKSLARMYEQMGMTSEALESLRDGLEIDPHNKELQSLRSTLEDPNSDGPSLAR